MKIHPFIILGIGIIEILGVPRMCFFSASQMCKTFYFRVTILKDNPRLPTIFAFGNQKKWLGNEKGCKNNFLIHLIQLGPLSN